MMPPRREKVREVTLRACQDAADPSCEMVGVQQGRNEGRPGEVDYAAVDRSGQGNARGERAGRLQDLEAGRRLCHEGELQEDFFCFYLQLDAMQHHFKELLAAT